MIQFNQVSKTYAAQRYALQAINFQVKPREMVFFAGHSGAGKSTLLKLIIRSEKPTHGEIIVWKKNLAQLSQSLLAKYRRNIGMISQIPHLINSKNIFTNVALPLYIANYSKKEINYHTRKILDKVGLLDKITTYPTELSLGEQQRVNIARALIHKPQLILADEPNSYLDESLSTEILELFNQANQAGATILITSQYLNLLKKIQHRIINLQDGILIG